MLKNDIVGEFGESFIASLFYSMGYEVDIVNATGIDLTAYKDDEKWGISVKSRNIQFGPNDSILLKYNDIVYTDSESRLRSVEPAYAFIISDLERIDILVVTQKYLFNNLIAKKDPIKNIEHYKRLYSSKEVSGSSKSVNTSKLSREKWLKLKDEKGVIFVGSYLLKENI